MPLTPAQLKSQFDQKKSARRQALLAKIPALFVDEAAASNEQNIDDFELVLGAQNFGDDTRRIERMFRRNQTEFEAETALTLHEGKLMTLARKAALPPPPPPPEPTPNPVPVTPDPAPVVLPTNPPTP